MFKPKFVKKAIIGATGLAVASSVDHVSDRPTGLNPTLTRLGFVCAAMVAWEYAEAMLERKFGLGPKN